MKYAVTVMVTIQPVNPDGTFGDAVVKTESFESVYYSPADALAADIISDVRTDYETPANLAPDSYQDSGPHSHPEDSGPATVPSAS